MTTLATRLQAPLITPETSVVPLFPIDQHEEQKQQFETWTWGYWFKEGDRVPSSQQGVLLSVEGVPLNIAAVDGFQAGMQKTTLAFDSSRRTEGRLSWLLTSEGQYLKFSRELVVEEAGVSASIDFRRKPGYQGTHEQIGGVALLAFIDITKGLVAQASTATANQLPLDWRS